MLGIDELGSVCRQHLLVGTSAANALDALAKFIGRSVPFVLKSITASSSSPPETARQSGLRRA